jgi:hypothetical protein
MGLLNKLMKMNNEGREEDEEMNVLLDVIDIQIQWLLF